MDAQIRLRKEECASGMGQRLRPKYASQTDALIEQSKEEYVLGMEQRRNDAAKKDVQTRFSREVCV